MRDRSCRGSGYSSDPQLPTLKKKRFYGAVIDGQYRACVAITDKLTPGKHVIAFAFTYDGGGIGKGGQGTLSVDGKKVAEGRIPTMPRTRPLVTSRPIAHSQRNSLPLL